MRSVLRLVAAIALCCLVAQPSEAQPATPDTTRAQALLRSLELDAIAIRTTSLTSDAVVLTASSMQKRIDDLPLVLGVQSAELSAIEVAMRAHVAHLVEVAGYPDRFLSAGAADDLVADIARLRDAAAIPR